MKVKALVAQLCPTLCDLVDCSLPGSSVHGILETGILEWVAIPFSRGSSWPRDWTQVSCIAGGFLTNWATRETHHSATFPPHPHLPSPWTWTWNYLVTRIRICFPKIFSLEREHYSIRGFFLKSICESALWVQAEMFVFIGNLCMLTEFIFSVVMKFWGIVASLYLWSYIKTLQGHLNEFKLEIKIMQ